MSSVLRIHTKSLSATRCSSRGSFRCRNLSRSTAFIAIVLALSTFTGLFFSPDPVTAQVEIVNSPPELQKGPKGELIPVIVVADRAKIHKSPSRTAPKIASAAFLDAYLLLDTVTRGGRSFHLAGKADGSLGAPSEVVGWLADDDVLIRSQAIKEKSGIFLKGLVVNQWEDAGSGVSIEGASVRSGPGLDAAGNPFKGRAEIGLFSFYFIYKKHRDSRKQYFLIGESPILRNITQPQETLVGWVEEGRLREWSTRQAVQFDKKTLTGRKDGEVGAKIFPEERELIAYLRGETSLEGADLEPVAEEDTSVLSWQHNWPRFPLFETKKNRQVPSAGPLYRVGFIGDQIYVDGRSGASREELAENIQKVDKLTSEIRDIDLLFVIDSTGSMRSYFSAAADAVLKIAAKVREEFPVGDEGPNIRFSVVFYRDYVDEDGKPEPTDTYLTKRLPFTGNQSAVAKFLRDEEKMLCDGCGGDEPEAVFYGLEYAINTAAKEPRDGVGLRAVVLMGDKGNHRRDPRGLNTESVAGAIKDQRYDFFCFHLVSRSHAERDAEARAFSDQCRDIGRRVELTSQSDVFTSKEPASIAAAIVDAARSVAKDLEKTREAARRVSRGEAGLVDIRRQYGVRLTQRLSDMMVDKGIDPNLFIDKSVQLFGQGWVTEREPLSGKRQIEPVLLVDRATLDQLLGLLAGMTREPPNQRNVVNLWTKALKDMTQGEPDVEKPLSELIESHLGIPIRKNLLAKTLSEIAALPPDQLSNLYNQLFEDLHRIRGLQSEKHLEVSRDADGELEVKELGTRRVWWQGKGNREYAWISLDDLP